MICNPNRLAAYLLAVPALLCLPGYAVASSMYVDVEAATTMMTMIEETSPSSDAGPLFGQPTASLAGDNYDFAPTSGVPFAATSTDGGTDFTDGSLSFMIHAKPGYGITSLEVAENGFVELLNLSDGISFASVSGSVDIDVNEIDGAGVGSIDLVEALMSFSPNDGQYLHSDVATSPLFRTNWAGGVDIDIAAALADQQIGGKATKITVTIDNSLLASTVGLGTGAKIDKKDFDINVRTMERDRPAIPEPSALALAGFGLVGVLGGTRRRAMA